jgi:hypothetical protein
MNANYDDVYIQALFGQHAVRAPMWMYVQNQEKDGVLFVGPASRRPCASGAP